MSVIDNIRKNIEAARVLAEKRVAKLRKEAKRAELVPIVTDGFANDVMKRFGDCVAKEQLAMAEASNELAKELAEIVSTIDAKAKAVVS